jgi:hypothetical protein
MAKSFQTIFTNLTDRFSGTANRGGQPASAGEVQPRNREVISASSREELDAKKLQVQQNRALRSQFLRMVGADSDKKVMYESNRMAQYMDYQRMEYYPIISAALDLLAEESTTVGQDGKMMKVYSTNKRVKSELENLFTNTLDLNSILQFWARNLVKYGDNFVYLLLDEKRGVIGAKQLTNVEVERVEEIVDDKLIVKFKYKNGSVEEEYTTWQVAHFRLLGDDRRMPYGMSVLDKVRRTFKMLTLFEDSMMVYRITRAAERRIFKVDVGDMPEEDVDQFVEQVARSAKSTKLVDDVTGDFNWKYNVATNDSDYFVPVRNGSTGSPIETLPGAGNLSDIGDISYLRDNLFTGLGIPKAFLGFSDDSGGEGKALSMLDIRFARKVNKIQQSLVSELNKIAMIHLYILGGDYREHLDDFTLTLANPSTQAEILKIETLKAKFDTFEQATRIGDNGTKAWSEIRAKREILGMSDEEIMDDLQEQMIEAKIGDEIKASGQLIRSSGLFDKLIKYKNAGFLNQPTTPGAEGGPEGGAGGADPMGGGGGGADPLADLGGGGDAGAAPDAGGGDDPLAAGPMNERMSKGKKLARGLNSILKESQLSKDLNGLVNGKESRLITENINMENSLNQLIDDLEKGE